MLFGPYVDVWCQPMKNSVFYAFHTITLHSTIFLAPKRWKTSSAGPKSEEPGIGVQATAGALPTALPRTRSLFDLQSFRACFYSLVYSTG